MAKVQHMQEKQGELARRIAKDHSLAAGGVTKSDSPRKKSVKKKKKTAKARAQLSTKMPRVRRKSRSNR